MEQNFQTSFIPKKPMVEEKIKSSRPVSFLTVISIFVFFAIALASLGLYFYKSVSVKNLEKMKIDLVLAKSRFEPERIEQLQILDKRLRAADFILKKHLSISPVFEALQSITMKTVRFTKFSYEMDVEKSVILVKLSGQALGYRSIALQSDLLAKNKNLIDPVFSNLSLDEKGNVLFDLEFLVDPSLVNYKQRISLANEDFSESPRVEETIVN